MRIDLTYLKQYLPCFFVILLVEGFCALLLWLSDIRLFLSLILLMLLFSIFVFFVLGFLFYRKEKNKEAALIAFLSEPGIETELRLKSAFASNKEMIRALMAYVYAGESELERGKLHLSDYETYVETWAHEVKLPLSLLTMILDNKKGELDAELAFKLDYIRNQIQNQISQILFYYRLRSEKNDFYLERFRVDEAICEILEDYAPLLEEKNFRVSTGDMCFKLYTDRRSFDFMMGQVIGNAIKYSDSSSDRERERTIDIALSRSGHQTILTVKDGGRGVKPCDLPHIFDKGFTGDTGKIRKRSSGMGLYLVKELAQALNIEIEVETVWGGGFAISFIYKKTKSEPGSLES